MTYKSTLFKPKINVDSTILKCLSLQPTFLAPPFMIVYSTVIQSRGGRGLDVIRLQKLLVDFVIFQISRFEHF